MKRILLFPLFLVINLVAMNQEQTMKQRNTPKAPVTVKMEDSVAIELQRLLLKQFEENTPMSANQRETLEAFRSLQPQTKSAPPTAPANIIVTPNQGKDPLHMLQDLASGFCLIKSLLPCTGCLP